MDLSNFLKENETPSTRAYEHALDLAYLFVGEMDRQGLSKKDLAEKMGVSQSRLSNLLNTQPNSCGSEITTVISDLSFGDFASSVPVAEFSGKTSTAFSGGVKNVNLSGELEVAAA